jgi:hypothetical protein
MKNCNVNVSGVLCEIIIINENDNNWLLKNEEENDG